MPSGDRSSGGEFGLDKKRWLRREQWFKERERLRGGLLIRRRDPMVRDVECGYSVLRQATNEGGLRELQEA